MERFTLKKLNNVEDKEQYQVKSQTNLQVLKTWMTIQTPIGIGKALDRIQKLKPASTREQYTKENIKCRVFLD
jgi:hypothetical protein